MLIHSLDASGECADVLGMSLERMFGGLPHTPPSAPREILCFGWTLSSVSMCDLNRLRANVVFFFKCQLTFGNSLLRPLAIVRELRVDDKSFPVSCLSCARGSMPLSACHGRPVCPVNRQQINPSQQNHTVWRCFSLHSR